MTTASFFKKNGKFCKFQISGHSGYAEEGNDIVCAAVSSMAFLTINNLTDGFKIPCNVSLDQETTEIKCALVDETDDCGSTLIAGLYRELITLADDYPKFVRVIVK